MKSREPSASFSEHRSRVVVDFSTFSLLPDKIPYGQATFRLSIVSWGPFGALSLLGRGDDPAVRLHVRICVDRCAHSLGGTAGSGAGARGDAVFKHLGKRSAAPFRVPAGRARALQFLRIFTNACCRQAFRISPSSWVWRLWFSPASPRWLPMLRTSPCAYWPFVYLLWRNVFQVLYPFSNLVYFGC